MLKSEWTTKGFADEPVLAKNKEELVEMIAALKRE